MEIDPKHKFIAGIEFISAGALILFWLGYFLIEFMPIATPYYYSNFQGAIPLLDICLALTLIVAGIKVLNAEKSGKLLSYINAAVFLFLGVVGLNLKTQSGIYLVSMVSMLSSGFVNLWCLIFGMYIFILFKEKRSRKKS